MNFDEMSVDEIINYFSIKYNNKEPIYIKELREAANVCSIVDPIANDNAMTIFYSGGEDEIANALASSNNENIRLIRRTDKFKFLAYDDDEGNSFEN